MLNVLVTAFVLAATLVVPIVAPPPPTCPLRGGAIGCVSHTIRGKDTPTCKYYCTPCGGGGKGGKRGRISGCQSNYNITCSNSDDTKFAACGDSCRRVLSDFNTDGRDRQLFDLLEGEELEEQLRMYEERKHNQGSLGICNFPGSSFHKKDATSSQCFHPDNQQTINHDYDENDNYKEVEPWVFPTIDGAILLAADPGIWAIHSFLGEEEIDKLIKLIHKYGDELKLFGPCRDEVISPRNAQPTVGKVCFKMSADDACEGPFEHTKCQTKTFEEDSPFIDGILTKFNDMWSLPADASSYASPYASAYVKFHRYEGGTPPVDMHQDNFMSITFVLYLSDGGAQIMFPNVNVTVTPKKGHALTWLNKYNDGRLNSRAAHAVQAHPKGTGTRLSMVIEVVASTTK